MKRLLLIAMALFVLVVPAAQADTISLLFSLDARGTTVTRAEGGLRLTVPAATALVWFSDRPKRLAGHTTLPVLVRSWSRYGFDKDPPNAALVLRRTSSGDARQHVVELTLPRIRGRVVTFQVRELPNGTVTGRKHTHAVMPGTYAQAELFIDDATITMTGGSGGTIVF